MSVRWHCQAFVLAVIVGLILGVGFVRAFGGEPIRIDTYDKYSNRTGYATVDPKTGRVDTFDKYSNRTGSGQITPPPASSLPVPPPPAPAVSGPCSRPPCPRY